MQTMKKFQSDMWLVIIPQCIFQYGRPNSKIQKDESNISVGLKPKDRNSDMLLLFPDMQEEVDRLNEAYQFEINFHNQLKARILSSQNHYTNHQGGQNKL